MQSVESIVNCRKCLGLSQTYTERRASFVSCSVQCLNRKQKFFRHFTDD